MPNNVGDITQTQYNASRPALVDSGVARFQATSDASLSIAERFLPQYEDNTNQVAWMHARPLATGSETSAGQNLNWKDYVVFTDSGVIKASAGRLYIVMLQSRSQSEKFIQIHNSATVPAEAAVPVITIPIPAGGSISLDLSLYGRYFGTGMSWVVSSTMSTKTLAAAEIIGNIGYL
jgi:hypothetical protein